jgi:hypothetical protein
MKAGRNGFAVFIVALAGCFSNVGIAGAAYQDVINFFDCINTTTTFPVAGRTLSDLESAFGPRIQTSGGNYDWHRGVEIDGTLNTDLIVAPVEGYLPERQWGTVRED